MSTKSGASLARTRSAALARACPCLVLSPACCAPVPHCTALACAVCRSAPPPHRFFRRLQLEAPRGEPQHFGGDDIAALRRRLDRLGRHVEEDGKEAASAAVAGPAVGAKSDASALESSGPTWPRRARDASYVLSGGTTGSTVGARSHGGTEARRRRRLAHGRHWGAWWKPCSASHQLATRPLLEAPLCCTRVTPAVLCGIRPQRRAAERLRTWTAIRGAPRGKQISRLLRSPHRRPRPPWTPSHGECAAISCGSARCGL